MFNLTLSDALSIASIVITIGIFVYSLLVWKSDNAKSAVEQQKIKSIVTVLFNQINDMSTNGKKLELTEDGYGNRHVGVGAKIKQNETVGADLTKKQNEVRKRRMDLYTPSRHRRDRTCQDLPVRHWPVP